MRHNRAGGDDGVRPDGDAGHDDGLVADEDVVADIDFADLVDRYAVSAFEHGDRAVVTEQGAPGQMHVVAEAHVGGIGNDGIHLDQAALADRGKTEMALDDFSPLRAIRLAQAAVEAKQSAGANGMGGDEATQQVHEHVQTFFAVRLCSLRLRRRSCWRAGSARLMNIAPKCCVPAS